VIASNADSDELLESVSRGDAQAESQLFARHRERLKRVVAKRLDSRLRARLDPSDVVQEVYALAHARLPIYLAERPIPFYSWLRQLTVERVSKLHEWHMRSQKRCVSREWTEISEGSLADLAERLAAPTSSPSERAEKRELQVRVQAALLRLREIDREVLHLRFVDQLSILEIAAVLDLAENAVKQRQLRALLRLKIMLENS
jgi:RNA polymerase sigma-70 factor, ECF subfamily